MKRFTTKCVINATILFVLFSSCKKQDITTQAGERTTPSAIAAKTEEAYPGLRGESIGFKFGKDSVYAEKKAGKYILFGDIALDQQSFEAFRTRGSKAGARTFVDDGYKLWPNGIIYYTIQSGFSAFEQTMIADAMNEWQTNTPVTFVQRTNQPNYVVFVPGSLNSGLFSDYIGMKAGVQIINLESNAFFTGNAIHEIGHVAGFYHEQCRVDRFNAIIVDYNNVVPHDNQHIYQFQTYGEINQGGFQIGNFDFGSVMLYGSFTFSDGVHPVMTTINGATFVGQRVGLSAGDIETAFYLYHPVFVRLTNVYTSQDNDWYKVNEEGYVAADFFQDAAGTIPLTNLNFPLSIKYGISTTPDCSTFFSSTGGTSVPAGAVSQVVIDYFNSHYESDANGNPLSCSRREVAVYNGAGYKIIQ